MVQNGAESIQQKRILQQDSVNNDLMGKGMAFAMLHGNRETASLSHKQIRGC